jgi:hypothetical protein
VLLMSQRESQTDVEDKEKQLYFSVFNGKYSDLISNINFFNILFLFVLLLYWKS